MQLNSGIALVSLHLHEVIGHHNKIIESYTCNLFKMGAYNTIQYNTLLILPEGFFRINFQYEYKITTKTSDINYNDIHYLNIKIMT